MFVKNNTRRQVISTTTMGGSKSKRSHAASITSLSTRSASINTKILKGKPKQSPEGVTSTASDKSDLMASKGSTHSNFIPPMTLFLKGTNQNQMVGDELAVRVVVGKRLFPHVKFICDPQIELVWSDNEKSICGLVRQACAPPENVEVEKWWENARKWVSRQIAILRSSKTTQLKWSFMSKSTSLCLFYESTILTKYFY